MKRVGAGEYLVVFTGGLQEVKFLDENFKVVDPRVILTLLSTGMARVEYEREEDMLQSGGRLFPIAVSETWKVVVLTSLPGKVAGDVWPDGAVIECKVCGSRQHLSTEECGRALFGGGLSSASHEGWPKHCGQTMIMIDTRNEAPNDRPRI